MRSGKIQPFMSENKLYYGVSVRKLALLFSLCLSVVWIAGPATLRFPKQTDIYPRWIGSRALFERGLSPYSETVTEEIQTGFYGKPLQSNDNAHDPQRFAYPLYVSFLFLPLLWLPLGALNYFFVLLFLAVITASFVFWLRLAKWKLAMPEFLLAWSVLVVSPPVIQGLRIQNLVVLVAALLALTVYLVSRGRLVSAGIALAYATIKPQAVLVPVLWFVLWSLRDWTTRKRLALSFVGTLTVLFLACSLLVPTWISEFVSAMLAYRSYIGLAKSSFGIISSTLVIGGLIPLMWRRASCAHNSREFAEFSAFAMTVQLLILWLLVAPNIIAPYQTILLLPFIVLSLAPKNVGQERPPLY